MLTVNSFIIIINLSVYDWMRLFGVELWYLTKPNENLDEVFRNFYDEKIKRAQNNKPVLSIFNNPDLGDRECIISRSFFMTFNLDYELEFLLVGLFANYKEFELHKYLNPYTYTEDCLDVKFLWFIDQHLSKSKINNQQGPGNRSVMVAEPTHEQICFKYRILRGFCYQLELLGLWEYAIYAVLIASPSITSRLDCTLILI